VNFFFRIDASRQIGAGHFVRCLALANELQSRGARSCFVCSHLPESFAGALKARGHELIRIETSLAGQEEDANRTLAAVGARRCEWLVVDHYALDIIWERRLRSMTKHLLVIDDLANRDHDCDVLVDQNYYLNAGTRYLGKVPDACNTLLGPKYALLREEFRLARSMAKPRDGLVRKILIFMGGGDEANYTAVAIDTLARLQFRQVQVDVVIGAEHFNLIEIESACANYGFSLHVQTDKMASLMIAADLAIGSGGSATWERCCLGLPCLAVSAASNQEQLLRDSAGSGALYAPAVSPNDSDGLSRHLRSLMENPSLLMSLSLNSMKLVDGRGVYRVLRAMGIIAVSVRLALKSDALNLFEWRNHPSIRRVSRNTEAIDWTMHQAWLGSVLGDSNRTLLIGEIESQPIGAVRFDMSGSSAEVSIYMVPGQEGRGLGADLLTAAEAWLRRNRPGVTRIDADVLGGNAVGRNLFSAACYDTEVTRFTKRMD
jgi:UDP-2,4-diacetamido-2,4,6-trideoxy-beta-L-altropyranose hydrolase